jgi:gliding motility-associated-like protein
MQVRFTYDDANTWAWYWMIDNVTVYNSTCNNPSGLSAVVTITTADLSWTAGGSESSWEVINQLAGTGAPSDTDTGTSVSTNAFQVTNLTEGADYEFYVRADCGTDGNSIWVGPLVYHVAGPGETCGNPILVTTPLPYTTDDNTSNYGDDYSGSPGATCGTTSGYLGGDDVVYAYTPTADTSIDISLTGVGTYTGLFVYTDCANIGVNCETGAVNGFAGGNMLIDNYSVTSGTTYYIVISTWPTPQSTAYTLTITENTCIDAVATYAVVSDCANGPQFLVDVDVTDLGSASTLTITDNQGSTAQTISAIGTYTFGPYPNTTGVVITVANDDDANCTLTSASLTREFCQDFVVDCTVGPETMSYCYDNGGANNPVIFTYTSSDGNSLNLTFNAGQVENGWDELVVIDTDGSFIVAPTDNFYGATGDLSGLTYQSTGDTISFYINSDGSGSCQSNSYTPIDVSVSCATCTNPTATYTVVGDCLTAPQFFVDVDITDLGSASTLTVTDNQGSTPQTASAVGVLTFGPYPNTTQVQITVTNDDDANCSKMSSMLTQAFCLENLVDCNVGPLSASYCYQSNDTNVFSYTSSDGSALNLTIDSGQVEGAPWDFLVILDSDGVTELYNGEGNDGDISGLTFQSTGDTIYFSITSDGSVSCSTGSFCCSDGINYTVSCATCINPAATYMVVDDCANGEQFLIDVNISSLGDANSLTISNSFDANTVPVTATGTYQIGPFPFLTDVVVTVNNDDDVNCVIHSNTFHLLACPPENDNPCNATVASVNADESCDLTTAGTIIEATPSGVPTGTCGGNPDDDVWFQFTALNEVQLISILNITGGTTNIDHAVYSGSCDGLTELYCSTNTASVTPELVVGNTYFIRVFSFGSVSETSSFDLCIKKAPNNIICENAANFCGEGGALYGSNIIGIPNDTQVACLYTIPNPSWNIIQIGDPGAINIQMVQNTEFDADGNPIGQGLDVDFVLWGPFDTSTDFCSLDLLQDCPTCPNNTSNPNFYPFGNIIDCSYSAAPVENLTIDNALSGEIYVLLVTNYSNQPGTIQIQQTNVGEAGAGSTVAEIQVDLGGDQDLCGFDEMVLNADSPFADSYEWYADGFIIDGATTSTLTVTESNVYTVIAYDENCGATAQDEVTVNFYLEPMANTPDDMVTCDDASADGVEDFNLESQTAAVLGAQNPDDFSVTYYASLADAQQGINALASPYLNTSNPQTIYVRVEDVDAVGSNSGCFATTSFDLVISGPTPTATSADMETCDDNSRDGFESFMLTDNDVNILDGQDATQYIVSYYATEADANAGTGALTSPYTNTTPNQQTIWARVESNLAFDCYSVVDFDLIVTPVPYATFNTDVVDYEVCPNATVPIQISLMPDGYTASDVTVEWFRDQGLIDGQTGLTLPVLMAGTYTAIITSTTSDCTYELSTEVIELAQCIIPQGISPNGDGFNDNFDLSSFGVTKIEIFNRNGTLVYSKTNYVDEWHGQTNSGDNLPVGTYFYTMTYDGGKQKSAWVYINK